MAMRTPFTFGRGLSSEFINKLNYEYDSGGWWRSIVLDTDLFVGIRKESLNVYWRGASLLKIEMVGGVLIGEIHYKYLLVPSTPKSYIQVHDGTAALPEDVASLFNTDLSNLSAMKHAANPYVGEEKLGVHQVVMSNCNIIDVEVALGPETSD
jgi:hypothetical protein